MMHSATVAIRRRMTPRHVSIGRWMPVLLSALALVTGAPCRMGAHWNYDHPDRQPRGRVEWGSHDPDGRRNVHLFR